jgi:hypothetical protein
MDWTGQCTNTQQYNTDNFIDQKEGHTARTIGKHKFCRRGVGGEKLGQKYWQNEFGRE